MVGVCILSLLLLDLDLLDLLLDSIDVVLLVRQELEQRSLIGAVEYLRLKCGLDVLGTFLQRRLGLPFSLLLEG
jgi:hypothetical protein